MSNTAIPIAPSLLTTLPPRSSTVWAADNPERPPPTMITFAFDMTDGCGVVDDM